MTQEETQKFKDWCNVVAKTIKAQEAKISLLQKDFLALQKLVDGYKTLLVDLRGEDAVDLHGSMTPKSIGEMPIENVVENLEEGLHEVPWDKDKIFKK